MTPTFTKREREMIELMAEISALNVTAILRKGWGTETHRDGLKVIQSILHKLGKK